MAKPSCNFEDKDRAKLSHVYQVVKDIERKLDYVIESLRDLYYRGRPDEPVDEGGTDEYHG